MELCIVGQFATQWSKLCAEKKKTPRCYNTRCRWDRKQNRTLFALYQSLIEIVSYSYFEWLTEMIFNGPSRTPATDAPHWADTAGGAPPHYALWFSRCEVSRFEGDLLLPALRWSPFCFNCLGTVMHFVFDISWFLLVLQDSGHFLLTIWLTPNHIKSLFLKLLTASP